MESIVEIALACILSTVLFASLIIYISKHPQKRTVPLKTAFIIMFVGGIFIYCTCHYRVLELEINGKINDSSLEWVMNGNADEGKSCEERAFEVVCVSLHVWVRRYGEGGIYTACEETSERDKGVRQILNQSNKRQKETDTCMPC